MSVRVRWLRSVLRIPIHGSVVDTGLERRDKKRFTRIHCERSLRKQSLMDYVLGMFLLHMIFVRQNWKLKGLMEEYAASLEQEVEERTRELTNEKKKADVLLYRMLPRQVVDKLKLGELVEPEQFQVSKH